MNSSDGNSAAPPLRKRKSKRFDRSGSNQRLGGSAGSAAKSAAVTDDGVAGDAGLADEVEGANVGLNGETERGGDAAAPTEADAATDAVELDNDSSTGAAGSMTKPFVPIGQRSPSASAGAPSSTVVTDGAVRAKPLDERQACGRCGHELSMVNIEVDGNVLIMESCDNCDLRRWQLAGEPIDLQQVLDHVGEHAGRRR